MAKVVHVETKRLKFLIVEDDETVRFLRRRELEIQFADCSIVECETAQDGIRKSGETAYTAIITDHKLPDETGAELIAHLRGQGVRCPIIMVTGSDDPSVHRKAREAGATSVVYGSRPKFAESLKALLAGEQIATGTD